MTAHVSWFDRGACAKLPRLRQQLQGPEPPTDEAKVLCDICPVWRECLAWAYDQRLDWGYMGRMSAKARKRHADVASAIAEKDRFDARANGA